jgi:hypothetical protein
VNKLLTASLGAGGQADGQAGRHTYVDPVLGNGLKWGRVPKPPRRIQVPCVPVMSIPVDYASVQGWGWTGATDAVGRGEAGPCTSRGAWESLFGPPCRHVPDTWLTSPSGIMQRPQAAAVWSHTQLTQPCLHCRAPHNSVDRVLFSDPQPLDDIDHRWRHYDTWRGHEL